MVNYQNYEGHDQEYGIKPESVPPELSRIGATIDLRSINPDDKALIFRDMGFVPKLVTPGIAMEVAQGLEAMVKSREAQRKSNV